MTISVHLKSGLIIRVTFAGHSIHIQVGGDNPKVQKITSMQNKAIFYFHFDIFIFENKVAGRKMELDGQFALCPTAVECPAFDGIKGFIRGGLPYIWGGVGGGECILLFLSLLNILYWSKPDACWTTGVSLANFQRSLYNV